MSIAIGTCFNSGGGPGTPLLGYTDGSLRFWVLVLVGLLLASALIVSIVQRWRDKPGRLSPTADEELSQYRRMYERGEITHEEFQRLRMFLGGRIRARMGRGTHPELDPPSPPRQPPTSNESPPEGG